MVQVNNIITNRAKQLGAVYTPDLLSDWVSSLLLKNMSKGTILDPACGDGALLYTVSQKCKNNLVGIDIVNNELKKVHDRINTNLITTFNLDSLNPKPTINPFTFWSDLFSKLNVKAIISNPPWGAELGQTTKELINLKFTLAEGQYDSYELFIELMLTSAPAGTVMALIIPDSLFLPEHKNLRKFIISNSKIKLIARLGEGFFKNVFRGTTVLLLEKSLDNLDDNVVESIRLNKQWRTNILTKNVTLADAQEVLTHKIPQKRFFDNKDYMFDIDILDSDNTIQKIETTKVLNLANFLDTGRGIELSKTGKIVKCHQCGYASPFPRKNNLIKCDCGNSFEATPQLEESIIQNKITTKSLPLIVGEDVSRYSCKPSRSILKNIKGINYKENVNFNVPKMLIRKTGVGINASIDYSGAYTNQVVFHYSSKNKKGTPDFFLEYVLGVVSSRVMCAYYLKKFGENEWRSHAYITQKIISQLPIPDIFSSPVKLKLAKNISDLVKRSTSASQKRRKLIDVQIEKKVIELFELNKSDIDWVINTINSAQQLKNLREIKLSEEQLISLYEL